MTSGVLDGCFQRILLHHTAIKKIKSLFLKIKSHILSYNIRFVATNSFPFNYFKSI